MSYLVFIVAVGAFALLGAGGPLHRDTWFELLNRRVDAIELDVWPSLALRVAAPLIGAGLVLWLSSGLVGGLAEALIGIALLYFAWGRGDYPTDSEKFLARARVGDVEGAQMLLSDASVGGTSEPLAVRAIRDLSYRGFARWFPPVLYFWLLGPFGAAAYRLTELSNARSAGQFDAALKLLDWLPSRLLLLSFAVLGNFERTRGVLTTDAFDQEVSHDELLANGIARAGSLDLESDEGPEAAVTAVEAMQKAMGRATALWIAVASVIALL